MKLLCRAHKKLSSVSAWENSKKAAVEADLKKIEVRINFISNSIMFYVFIFFYRVISNLGFLWFFLHWIWPKRKKLKFTFYFLYLIGRTGEEKGRSCRKDKKQNCCNPQGSWRKKSNNWGKERGRSS